MKRFISLLTTVMLILVPFMCYAEKHIPEFDQPFSIRNGIGYQHDKSAVQRAEKNAKLEDDGTVFVDYVELGEFFNVWLTYHFDSANKLSSFHYYIRSDAYSSLKNQLKSKYGTPIYHNEISPIKTSAWEEVLYNWNSDNYSVYPQTVTFDVNACDCWFIKFADCYVVLNSLESKQENTSLHLLAICQLVTLKWRAY